jgi:glycosyltransferase involved in cell wall biosynthesis
MDKLLTVVVPVYKVEKYIDKCLGSLVVPKKMMDLLEVIVVNDGTPDNSAIMAKEFEKKYPQTFTVIDKENGGHGSAWNRGLKEATGKYISFLDSDDWYDNSNFASLIEFLQNTDVDLVFTDINRCFVDGPTNRERFKITPNTVYDADTFDWFSLGQSTLDANFWHCVYKTSMLQPEYPLFLEKQFYDDGILLILPVAKAKNLIYFDKVVYNYLIGRVGQTTSQETVLKHFEDRKKLVYQLVAFQKNHSNVSEPKRKKIDSVVSWRVLRNFELISWLPYSQAKKEVKEWYSYMRKDLPQIKFSNHVKLYKALPFWAYWLFVQYEIRKN